MSKKYLGTIFVVMGIYFTGLLLYLYQWTMDGTILNWPLQWLAPSGIISLGVIGVYTILSGTILRQLDKRNQPPTS
jgi:hypothetical protein